MAGDLFGKDPSDMARIFDIKREPDRAFQEVGKLLASGDVFIYPTDTVYGLGCAAESDAGLRKIYELKQRPDLLPFSVAFPSLALLEARLDLPPAALKLARIFFPGALTIVTVCDGDPGWPSLLFSEGHRVGLRVPDHPFCLSLEGPVVTTSVNLSGQPPLLQVEEMAEQFGEKVAAYFMDPDLEHSSNVSASTIVEVDNRGKLRCLREGALPFQTLLEAL